MGNFSCSILGILLGMGMSGLGFPLFYGFWFSIDELRLESILDMGTSDWSFFIFRGRHGVGFYSFDLSPSLMGRVEVFRLCWKTKLLLRRVFGRRRRDEFKSSQYIYMYIEIHIISFDQIKIPDFGPPSPLLSEI